MIDLNKEFDLKLQYHGRFENFLIGFGVNPDNTYQPELRLVRIDTHVEKTHSTGEMAFFGDNVINRPHFHWYNLFYDKFFNKIGYESQEIPTDKIYESKVSEFLLKKKNIGISEPLLKEAMPFKEFLLIFNMIKKGRRILREDGFITVSKKLKKRPIEVLQQIINKEIF